jgi:hypothetical protein
MCVHDLRERDGGTGDRLSIRLVRPDEDVEWLDQVDCIRLYL